eukprot:167574-Amphidinium_carterae.2
MKMCICGICRSSRESRVTNSDGVVHTLSPPRTLGAVGTPTCQQKRSGDQVPSEKNLRSQEGQSHGRYPGFRSKIKGPSWLLVAQAKKLTSAVEGGRDSTCPSCLESWGQICSAAIRRGLKCY